MIQGGNSLKEMIYLDHAATTPMVEEAIEVMTEALKVNYGNASSIHQLGKKNRVLIEQARATMGESIGASAQEIIITSGGTESDNMALLKTAEAFADKGKHIITTAIEHSAVVAPLQHLKGQGFDITYLPVNKKGQVTVEQVKEAIRPETILVSIMYANNEVGSIQPIKEVGKYLDLLDQEIVFHTDAVQAYGVLDIDVNRLKVDLLSVSAHKMNGPKGIGFLYLRDGLNIPSLIMGGAQENGHRAGTENVPAILAFEKAIELNVANKKAHYKALKQYKEEFIKRLENSTVDHSINGTVKEAVPHVLSVTFPEMLSEMLLIQLDLNGVAVSAGSACSAGSLEASHVLKALYGPEAPEITHTVRFSFGQDNTSEEIDRVIDLLEQYAS